MTGCSVQPDDIRLYRVSILRDNIPRNIPRDFEFVYLIHPQYQKNSVAKKLRKTENCSNCGHTLSEDSYCSSCGQQNTDNSVSLWILIKDFIDDYFSFDSRLFKSIVPLLFKPGFLTKEFNTGKRVKFIPPLRMYFIISLVFFLIPKAEDPKEKSVISVDSTSVNSKEDQSGEIMEKADESSLNVSTNNETKGVNFNIADFDSTRLSEKHYVDSIANMVVDSLGMEKNSFWGKLFHRGIERVLILYDDGGKKFNEALMDNIPTMMFFLLPIFALFIKLFHFRRKLLYVHCVIFSLHFHAFAFLVLLFFNLIELTFFTHAWFDGIGIFLICTYLILAIKNVYEQSYTRVLLKFFGLAILYSFTLGFFFVVTVLATLLY
ncbi:MAG: hypothetical protein COB85_05470 [Bacteroidetes bacterium]|nr:MAG: hypothetical protein COB85_05470 [Bacteroidota bacterium]